MHTCIHIKTYVRFRWGQFPLIFYRQLFWHISIQEEVQKRRKPLALHMLLIFLKVSESNILYLYLYTCIGSGICKNRTRKYFVLNCEYIIVESTNFQKIKKFDISRLEILKYLINFITLMLIPSKVYFKCTIYFHVLPWRTVGSNNVFNERWLTITSRFRKFSKNIFLHTHFNIES